MEAAIILQVLNVVALLLLVGLTGWYARSTARTVRELRHQVRSVSKQSELIAKSAQVSAWAALTTAASNPEGKNPYVHLRKLVEELERFSAGGEDADETGERLS